MKCFLKTRSFKLSFKMFLTNQQILTLFLMVIALCATFTSSSPTQKQQQEDQQLEQLKAAERREDRCHDECVDQFTTLPVLCKRNYECRACWYKCSENNDPPGKQNQVIPATWQLRTVSMVLQDSLVLVDVAWQQSSTPFQCLVTWEVSGGGLMGNLLTESSSVQLSLWPDTRYRVQVTCKNKLTGSMSRSLPLAIDTTEAVKAADNSLTQSKPAIPKQAIASYITNVPLLTTTTLPLVPIDYIHPEGHMLSSLDIDYDPVMASNVRVSNWDMKVRKNRYQKYLDDRAKKYRKQEEQMKEEEERKAWEEGKEKNSDIIAIEPLHKTDKGILAVFTDIHKPLLFGMAAGITLLMLLLMFFACPLRKPKLSKDKAMLMAEDFNAHGLTLPPALTASRSIGVTTKNEKIEHECKSPAMCSRDTLRV